MMQMGGSPVPPTPIFPDGYTQVNWIGSTGGTYDCLYTNAISGSMSAFAAKQVPITYYGGYNWIFYTPDFQIRTALNFNRDQYYLDFLQNNGGTTWYRATFGLTAADNPTNRLIEVEYANNTLKVYLDGVLVDTATGLTDPYINAGEFDFYKGYQGGSFRTGGFKSYGIQYTIGGVDFNWLPCHNADNGYNRIYEPTLQILLGNNAVNMYG